MERPGLSRRLIQGLIIRTQFFSHLFPVIFPLLFYNNIAPVSSRPSTRKICPFRNRREPYEPALESYQEQENCYSTRFQNRQIFDPVSYKAHNRPPSKTYVTFPQLVLRQQLGWAAGSFGHYCGSIWFSIIVINFCINPEEQTSAIKNHFKTKSDLLFSAWSFFQKSVFSTRTSEASFSEKQRLLNKESKFPSGFFHGSRALLTETLTHLFLQFRSLGNDVGSENG